MCWRDALGGERASACGSEICYVVPWEGRELELERREERARASRVGLDMCWVVLWEARGLVLAGSVVCVLRGCFGMGLHCCKPSLFLFLCGCLKCMILNTWNALQLLSTIGSRRFMISGTRRQSFSILLLIRS